MIILIDPEKYELVVFDTPNLVTVNVEVNGEKITRFFPERLQEAIEYCQELGWPVRAFLKHGTWLWATRSLSPPDVGDMKIIDRLTKSDILEFLDSDKEDIFFIDYAMENQALIVTKDLFRNEKKDYPDRDWNGIERATLRSFEFLEDGQFMLPSLPPKEDGARLSFKGYKERIKDLEKRVELLESKIDGPEIPGTEIVQELTKDELESVVKEIFDRLLRDGGAIHMTLLLHTLASAVLGLDLKFSTAQGVWPDDWKETLMDRLGVEGKMMKWVRELSPRKLKLTRKNQFVSYA